MAADTGGGDVSGQPAPCRFCGSVKTCVAGDRAARWVHCNACGASGPTVSIVGCKGTSEQIARAKVKWETQFDLPQQAEDTT